MWLSVPVVLKCVSKSELELFQLLLTHVSREGPFCVAYHQLFTAENGIDYMDLKYVCASLTGIFEPAFTDESRESEGRNFLCKGAERPPLLMGPGG